MKNEKSQRPLVVKIGGSTLGSHDTTIDDVVELQKRGKEVVIIHGGGKLITEWLSKFGIQARFINGERVSDKPTLDVAVAVLAGLANKEIVAAINCRGGRAIGISGVDGGLIRCNMKDTSLGYVGEVSGVNITLIEGILRMGFIPVVATICLNMSSNSESQILNVNADIVAGEIAATLEAEKLIFLTDVDGIHDSGGKVLSKLTSYEAQGLIASGTAAGGMIPKIQACLKAINSNAATCIIDGRQSHALIKDTEGKISGTVIE